MKQKGITLIALVITIIVLLILAGVSIATLVGENGVIKKATTAREKTNIANVKEMAQTDILGCEAENRGSITGEQLQGILCKYFNGVPDTVEELEEALKNPEYSLKANDEYGGKSVEVKLSDIYDGELGDGMLADEPTGPIAEATQSYVGYYSDIDGNGSVDGIIYADLAVDGKGRWNNDDRSDYEYTAETEQLKIYTIGAEVESDKFGNERMPVISEVPGSDGKDRFYVMALEDVDTREHTWYSKAWDNKLPTEKNVGTSENDFGSGKINTEYWINDEANFKKKYPLVPDDMWQIIQNEDSTKKYNLDKWFVPSKSEWAAFGDMLYTKFNVTPGAQRKLGLKDYYWSSSQNNISLVHYATFRKGYIRQDVVDVCTYYVRLSATF